MSQYRELAELSAFLTVNTTSNVVVFASNVFSFGNSSINSNYIVSNLISVGNSTVNSTINSSALSVSSISVGNSTVNSIINSSALSVSSILLGNSTINSTVLSVSSISIGNSTINSSINSTSFSGSSNSAVFLTGNTTTNTFTVGTSVYFVSNGNVGIGNTIPAFKFHVSGDLNFTGNLYQNGISYVGGGGAYINSTGSVISNTNLSHIFRIHSDIVLANVLIAANNNAIACGPLIIDNNVVLEIAGELSIV